MNNTPISHNNFSQSINNTETQSLGDKANDLEESRKNAKLNQDLNRATTLVSGIQSAKITF
ncbi:hypothetical protein HA48_18600 [Pantoea wallisii]|uniref:Uncharacterized protein n=1 Tax=Pantoea wallisii TaxID=1076551 RepID=A0A1X1D046_9GAMM|nr:hypothetical protein [Pantoea wallisii]ORM69911.1 hypothetical protein HA48_18600 [Pantoea wallisii]